MSLINVSKIPLGLQHELHSLVITSHLKNYKWNTGEWAKVGYS